MELAGKSRRALPRKTLSVHWGEGPASAAASTTSAANQLGPMSEQMVDITDVLRRKAREVANDAVVKSPQFSLFQGTQALEINNKRLDSGIIELSVEEEEFDVLCKRSLQEVLATSDAIFRNVFIWLQNSSLSVTVFSCRYVEELLVIYNKDANKGISSCRFGTVENVSLDPELLLVHKVLRSVVLGALHLVRLCLTLGQSGVVYEEEDINTQTMNLNVITMVESNDILKELNDSVDFLKSKYADSKDSEILQLILKTLVQLINLPQFIALKVPKLTDCSTPPQSPAMVSSLAALVDSLVTHVDYLNSLPQIPGCFSMGIQKRLDNRLPSRDLIPLKSEDYSSLKVLVDDLQRIWAISNRLTSQDVVNHALNFANTHHHVISRAIYALFLVRDDATVFGVEKVSDFLNEEMLRFSCWDSEYINTSNEIVKQKVAELTHQISSVALEWLSVMNQNPCRQRQHFSRLITVFDTLEYNSENFERNLKEVFQVNEEFEYNGELVLALPITSWVCYVKMDIMLHVVLRGFELELYQTWEFHQMYWYVNYLVDNILLILDRVIEYNRSKIYKIQQMKNQLKKKKGDQKLRYKEKMMKRQAQIPSLQLFVDTLNKKIVQYKIIQGLAVLQSIQLQKYIKSGILKTPDFPFVQNEEILYKLRMKPFASVGVPSLPPYSHYQFHLKTSLKQPHTPQDINHVKSSILSNIKIITDGIQSKDVTVSMHICSQDWLHWFRQLQRSCIGIGLQLQKPITATQRVVIDSKGFHRYFPVVNSE